MIDTSIGLLIVVGLVFGSLWAQRRAQEGGPYGTRYRRLRLGLALAGLAVALLTFWSAMEDHRRADERQSPAVQPARP
jgi:hypothetical protein